jgi:hypothetical protein
MAGRPYFLMAGRPYYCKVFCLIWVLNLLTFTGKPWFFDSRSALLLQGFLLNLGAELFYFWLCAFIF